jgi:5-methylcytosine-specific restriction endonuclease McrA
MQRKNALLIRDNKKCFRCSKHIDINHTNIYMIRSLKDGGKYYLENLIPVCKDCEKILSKNSKKMNYLDIKENLYNLVKNN